MRRLPEVAAAGAAVLLLAGCTGLGQTTSTGGSGNGYVEGDGTYALVAVGKRTDPVHLTGSTTDGTTVDVAAWRGSVVVVNVWYAGCAPCRAEAPDLARAAADPANAGVHFLGVNTRDDAATAKAFDARFSMPYPSVLDADSGAALLSLRGTVPPQAVPSTVVLDTRGRPAARIIGRLAPDVLQGLVEDVENGSTKAPSAPATAAGEG
jgi:thiol-disulfide isomerase/thioredoxin